MIDEKEMKPLTQEQRERNIRTRQERRQKEWNESFCNICPLLTERAKQRYLQLGAFVCDDPMDEIFVISQTYPAEDIKDCKIVKNIYELYNKDRLRVEKLLKLMEENPKIQKITEIKVGNREGD